MNTSTFWEIDKRGKVTFDEPRLLRILHKNGFYTFCNEPDGTLEPQFLKRS
jgi:hypothetical protein